MEKLLSCFAYIPLFCKSKQGQPTECVSVGNIKSFVPDLVVQINYSLMSLWFTFHNIVLSNQKHICSVCEPSEDMVCV